LRDNILRKRLDQNVPTIATRVHTIWPSIPEAIGHTGLFDYVEFEAEYAPFDLFSLDNFCRAVELFEMSAVIKIDQEPRGFLAQRAIGAGFHGVLFADSRSPEDVQNCVRIVRPETPEDGGIHGVGTRRFTYMGYGGSPEYVQALRDVVVMIMVEKKGTVEQLEAALSVPGVDMIQWGGTDYSMSIGRAGQRNEPDIKAIERRVIETALRMGVQPRAEINSVDQAKYYIDLGVRHFCIGTDISILFSWWKDRGEGLRKVLSDL
jgi:4-hydroxy-2-oxoheptanedioate aldolase